MANVRIALVCAAIVLAGGTWAAAQPAAPQAAPAAGPAPAEADPHRPVFAHYMTCFGNSLEMHKQEIELAQRHGIDGFALNCGEWNGSRYIESAERIYEAARQLNSGFKLFLSADGLSDAANLGDMVKRFAAHPNQFRYHGRSVLSAWGGRPGNYAAALEALRKDGCPVCFVPQAFGERWQMAWSFETVLGFFRDQPHMDGVFYFAVDDSIGGTIRTNAMGRRGTQYLGKLFMAGAAPAYNSANLRDFQGMAGYAATWQGIVRDGPDWVELVTWNDYQEDSSLMPFRWQAGWEKAYFDHDESYLDVTGYYSAWFKSGTAPRITQDKAYFVYRNRSKRQARAWDAKAQKWTDITLCPWPYDQIHDDVGDFVYVTTFLTAPADLVVTIGRKDWTLAMPAGVAHARAPMLPGQPHFVLRRAGKTLADGWGRKEIIAEETPENSPVSNRLLNRTWPGAIVAGPVVRLEAESGRLDGGATIVKEGGVTAVAIGEAPGSGFTVPLKGLATATYDVRITYSNPSNQEARLTLLSDGVPRAPGEHPYFIPAFLPPTGKGKFRTVSFLWSLYSQGTYLSLQWRASADKAKPEWNDKGSALVDAIELVKVEPVAVPPARPVLYPELVAIPGGEFVMGAKDGEPDEAPPHKVRISPFAIGQFEVTNEEYEKFDPGHRKFRDGFSWRDREPVIYVSWVNAAPGRPTWPPTGSDCRPRPSGNTWRADAAKAASIRGATSPPTPSAATLRATASSGPRRTCAAKRPPARWSSAATPPAPAATASWTWPATSASGAPTGSTRTRRTRRPIRAAGRRPTTAASAADRGATTAWASDAPTASTTTPAMAGISTSACAWRCRRPGGRSSRRSERRARSMVSPPRRSTSGRRRGGCTAGRWRRPGGPNEARPPGSL